MNRRSFLAAVGTLMILPDRLADKMQSLGAEAERLGQRWRVVSKARGCLGGPLTIELGLRSLDNRVETKLTLDDKAPGYATAWKLELGEVVWLWTRSAG